MWRYGTLIAAALATAGLYGQSPELVLRFQHVPFGVGIGATGLAAIDLDFDQDDEIVAAASIGTTFGQNNFWYVLDRIGSGLEMRYVSSTYPSGITALRLANLVGNSLPEIVVASGNTIFVYDACSFQEIRRTTTTASEIRGLNIVDVDSDGNLEYVFTNSSGLFIFDVNTGNREYSSTAYPGYDVAVGNLDDDPDLEIVVGNDRSTGYVLNGRTRQVEWSYPNGFGYIVKIGDVNSDGINEIVGAYRWYHITVFSAYYRSPLAEIATRLDVTALNLGDVNRDGRLEIVYGDGQWGRVWVCDAETLAVLGSFNNPEHGVTNILVADTNGDGTNEVLWGAGYSSTGPDYLYIGDIETYEIVWQSQDIVPPFYAIAVGDLDNDGRTEVVYGSFESDSGYEDGIWFVRDGRTWELRYLHPRLTGASWGGLTRIALANVDADPQLEIFVNASDAYTGFVMCFDGVTFREQYRTAGVDGSQIKAIAVADVNRDGALELVLTGNREHTGATGVYAYLHNARTGALLWRSVSLGSYWGSLDFLRVGNVDTDPQLELVIAERGGQIIIYDGQTRLQQLITPARQVSALEVADLDGDGIQEVLVGTTNGALYVMNPSNGNIAQGLGNYSSQINGIQVADFLGTPEPDIIFCANERLHIRYRDAAGSIRVWQSSPLGTNVGALDSLRVADIDDDGTLEILLNVGFGLRVFRLATNLPQGDINRDGCVDDADLLCVLFDFGQTGNNLPEDLNRDGVVDDADLLIVLFNFGQGC